MILLISPYGEVSFTNRANAILALFVALIGMKCALNQGFAEGGDRTYIDSVMNRIFFVILLLILSTIGMFVYDSQGGRIEFTVGNFYIRWFDLIIGILAVFAPMAVIYSGRQPETMAAKIMP